MKKILQIIATQEKVGHLSHAYLIEGELEINLIAQLLKVKAADCFYLEEPPIKIQNIRELRSWIQLKPHSSPRKLAYLKEVNTMTIDAANALLKILEEPPENSVLVLQSPQNAKILPTIISRCQILKTKDIFQSKQIENYFSPEQIAKKSIKEKFNYASKIATSENLLEILNAWETDLRNRLLAGKDLRKLILKFFAVKDLLSTNSSVKLQLENLLLEFK